MSRPKARSRGGRGPGRIRAPLSDSGECKPRDRRRAGGGGRRARGLPERLARARRDGRRGGAWGELSKPLPFSRRKAPLRAGARRARAPRSQALGPGRAGVTSRPQRSGGRANKARGLRAQRRRTAKPAAARARRPGPHGWGVQSAVCGRLRVGWAVQARGAASRRGAGGRPVPSPPPEDGARRAGGRAGCARRVTSGPSASRSRQSSASASTASSTSSAVGSSSPSSPTAGASARRPSCAPGCVAVWISLSLRIETWV